MPRARIATQIQSKLQMLAFGTAGTGKSTLASQFAYFKRPDGKPFRVLYIDNENGSIDDFIGGLEDDGINTANIYIVYTQSLSETREYINKVKNKEDFHVLDDEGNETDEIVLDGDGEPFRADVIVVDGTTILNLTTKQALVEFSKKRNTVKAKKKELTGIEKTVTIEGAGLELKDYQTINFKGQDLILDLMSCGVHFIVTARETDEKINVTDSNGNTTNVSTGKKVPEGFRQIDYNVKTVIRMCIDKDGNYYSIISKDRTGVHNNETVEDLSLLDWQVIIDRTKDKKEFSVKNDLTKAVDIEQDIYTKEVMGKVGEPVDSIETNENSAENQITELLDKISAVMKGLNPIGKTKAKEALLAEDLPVKSTEMKKITDIKTLERVLEVISKI
jgi:hypothetical protein